METDNGTPPPPGTDDGTNGTPPGGDPPQPKPTETVDFWKTKAREQEKRAKENADAAKRLEEFEQASKSDIEKAMDRVTKAEAEVASVPAKVSEALRTHLVELHEISAEDAELFLTATDPEVLLKQVNGLIGRAKSARRNGNQVPREGTNPPAGGGDDRDAVRGLFGSTT